MVNHILIKSVKVQRHRQEESIEVSIKSVIVTLYREVEVRKERKILE